MERILDVVSLTRIPDYDLVHLRWTIPAFSVLLALYFPLRTSIDCFRVGSLVFIAIAYTIPWDSYLIRSDIWSYPPDATFNVTFYSIPAEELFFFAIQTCFTSVLYLILSKPVLHPALIPTHEYPSSTSHMALHRLGSLWFAAGTGSGAWLYWRGGQGTYMGLILVWACPILQFIWSVAGLHIIAMPALSSLGPILLSTAYMWILDATALQRGTWVIESGTKFNVQLWGHLDVEEAVFFLITNFLVVFGQIAIDRAYGILTIYAIDFPSTASHTFFSAPFSLIASFSVTSRYLNNEVITHRLNNLRDTSLILKGKSRSFWTASSIFQGPLRIELINLYAFCRVIDDLIDDDARTRQEGHEILKHVRAFIDRWYTSGIPAGQEGSHFDDLLKPLNLSTAQRRAFFALPRTSSGSSIKYKLVEDPLREPLLELLDGFDSDLIFKESEKAGAPPNEILIHNDEDLILYAYRVAGTVAKMCCHMIFHYAPTSYNSPRPREEILDAAVKMGMALQFVNIARDIRVDERAGRVYVPREWWIGNFSKAESSESVDHHGSNAKPVTTQSPYHFPPDEARIHRLHLLQMAKDFFLTSRPAIDQMPTIFSARKGLRVAVESYMEIGRQLEKKIGDTQYTLDADDIFAMTPLQTRLTRPSVPKWRRVWVAWSTLVTG